MVSYGTHSDILPDSMNTVHEFI